MKSINKIFISVWTVATLAACSGDFLDTAPTSSTATPTVFAATSNVKMAVNGLAYLMKSQHQAYSQGYCGENRIRSIYNEFISQEFRYNRLASGWAPIMNGEYYSRKATNYCKYPWAYYYEIISNANGIIHNVDGVPGDEKEKQFYKAQALTFRAYCYSQLMKLYTPRWQDTNNGAVDGIVLRLDESTGPLALSTVLECYDQIYKDLDDAIGYFKASGLDREASEFYLTNINVAYAIYARTALNRQDYPTALSNAKLARVGYPLMSNAEYAAGFCNPTSEWIFGSFEDETENNWYWTFGTQFGCNGYYTQKTEYGAGDIAKELTDRMPTDDIRMKCFLTADKFPGFDFTDAKVMSQTFGTFLNADLVAAAKKYVDSRTPSGLAAAYQTGVYNLGGQLKFWVKGTPGVADLCHIRSSEMLLIEAEANYFQNDATAAQKALVELNATSGRNPAYTCTKTGDDLFQEIVDYRSLELWGEGFNWYDMKRWNKDIKRLGFAEGGNCHPATATTVSASSSNWTWAIPETETDHNNLIKK